MTLRGALLLTLATLGVVALSGCDPLPPAPPGVKPQARPADLAPAPKPPVVPKGPSEESLALANYYAQVQSDLLAQGLLRTDGGGPDTPITDTMLVRNFVRIALEEEYERGEGLRPSNGAPGRIKKWELPVRVTAEFGPSVSEAQRTKDTAELSRYVDRLSRVTGHPVLMSESAANFHVLFMSEDDRALIKPRIRALVPDINPASLAIFDRLPRAIHCLVIAFSDSPGGYSYGRAIALVRAEHPDLLRRSCIHEEVAQGLGLANDSPRARPSIFNDDDEFALLTTQDEYLLKMLYNPRLTPGMSAEEVLPIASELASTLIGGPS
ncbi:DUF2927 domain-containing protein [Puniceibacterium sp. IMCC21224]|uniref:DUF2927 domain-containing protein n=1 Tax=Puniceibacterium sp. IMCC21224 TaxID=1618204 RepID=UPI00064DC1C1|nr:DUF2927 domain-containing protein [Puniceibacterium sp. IMCC21224]KMK66747.1 Protein of unknown function (DUF2927) [Puniceibacterium sp. IMCC21224]